MASSTTIASCPLPERNHCLTLEADAPIVYNSRDIHLVSDCMPNKRPQRSSFRRAGRIRTTPCTDTVPILRSRHECSGIQHRPNAICLVPIWQVEYINRFFMTNDGLLHHNPVAISSADLPRYPMWTRYVIRLVLTRNNHSRVEVEGRGCAS